MAKVQRKPAVITGWPIFHAIILLGLLNIAFQSGILVMSERVEQEYPDIVRFVLELGNAETVEAVDLIYSTNGRSCQSSVVRQPVDFEAGDTPTIMWEWELKRSGTLPPGAVVSWHWEIFDNSGDVTVTAPRTHIIVDPNHSWSRVEEDGVAVQWYAGGDLFGEEMLRIALESLERLEREMGIRPEDDILITVYPTAEDVQSAVLFTPEWTGGVAFPEFNTTIIGVGPGEFVWANSVVPHELAHLVVGALTFNCKGVRLPTWLEEGLAEMLEGPLESYEVSRVVNALERDDLPQLRSLERGFSAYGTDATLSYIQSAMVVQFLVDSYGPESLADLLSAVQSGSSVDAALNTVYGFDTRGLDAAWRQSLGFEADFNAETEEQATPTEVPTLALVNPGFIPSTKTPTPAPEQVAVVDPTATPAAITGAAQPVEEDVETPSAVAEPPEDEPGGSLPNWLWVLLTIPLMAIAAWRVLALKGKQNSGE